MATNKKNREAVLLYPIMIEGELKVKGRRVVLSPADFKDLTRRGKAAPYDAKAEQEAEKKQGKETGKKG